ncbi:MAG: hypothetical protein PHC88_00670 [Terrimicrobiaceae bacterium]|nr:hypothetical protein [Terrimicrobiaceae bacterium]
MMNMPALSMIFGLLLAALGAGSFAATGGTHPTALIPAAFGAVLVLCGIAGAVAPKLRMHVMHVAALAGLLGTAGGLGMSLPKLHALLTGGPVARPLAVWMQLAMGLICLVFLALCVKSFIDARSVRNFQLPPA